MGRCKAMDTPNQRRRRREQRELVIIDERQHKGKPLRKIVLLDKTFEHYVKCDLVEVLDRLDKLEVDVRNIGNNIPTPAAILFGAIADMVTSSQALDPTRQEFERLKKGA